jgi:hypothetical protein
VETVSAVICAGGAVGCGLGAGVGVGAGVVAGVAVGVDAGVGVGSSAAKSENISMVNNVSILISLMGMASSRTML